MPSYNTWLSVHEPELYAEYLSKQVQGVKKPKTKRKRKTKERDKE